MFKLAMGCHLVCLSCDGHDRGWLTLCEYYRHKLWGLLAAALSRASSLHSDKRVWGVLRLVLALAFHRNLKNTLEDWHRIMLFWQNFFFMSLSFCHSSSWSWEEDYWKDPFITPVKSGSSLNLVNHGWLKQL